MRETRGQRRMTHQMMMLINFPWDRAPQIPQRHQPPVHRASPYLTRARLLGGNILSSCSISKGSISYPHYCKFAQCKIKGSEMKGQFIIFLQFQVGEPWLQRKMSSPWQVISTDESDYEVMSV